MLSFKKFLGIISILIFAVFAMMFGTSYAWYSYKDASTEFDVTTSNNDIVVTFQRGEYINTNIAVPITSDQIDKYSEKSNFTVRLSEYNDEATMLIDISLDNIQIDDKLKDEHFKMELYHQNQLVGGVIDGVSIGNAGTTMSLGSIALDEDIENNFELRLYILDNGIYGDGDESNGEEVNLNRMMNQTFQAQIKINVLSRVNFTEKDFSNPDLYVSNIKIDGNKVNYLPVDGYYDMEAVCEKGSKLSWEPYSKTLIYENGSKSNDKCSLSFTSVTSNKLLNTVEPGSYVKYVGNNGCDGKHCEGQNANYENDKRMGYCGNEKNYFTVNGWRVLYVKDGSAYLVSAGAPECVQTYAVNPDVDNPMELASIDGGDVSLYYGSGYTFDENTGVYTLTGFTSSALSALNDADSIIEDTPYTCINGTSSTCTTMHKVYSIDSTNGVMAIPYYNYDGVGVPNHIKKLNRIARTYCNKKFAYKGVCDENSAWAMNSNDFEAVFNKNMYINNECFNVLSNVVCGYNNNLIDVGSQYWFANEQDYSSSKALFWYWNRHVSSDISSSLYGIRPVIRLDSKVLVSGGAGTYEDPYLITIR